MCCCCIICGAAGSGAIIWCCSCWCGWCIMSSGGVPNSPENWLSCGGAKPGIPREPSCCGGSIAAALEMPLERALWRSGGRDEERVPLAPPNMPAASAAALAAATAAAALAAAVLAACAGLLLGAYMPLRIMCGFCWAPPFAASWVALCGRSRGRETWPFIAWPCGPFPFFREGFCSGISKGIWGAVGSSGKLVLAFGPRMARAAASYACAASSAVSKVPSHTREPRVGSRISAAQLPHGR
mmetsp:Transcript_18580/g.60569  ORF Transcript_18580/g.60569 Transcript_18580/m.60569 type:complete len:241 (+) Transcript_18580:444-1166(+)